MSNKRSSPCLAIVMVGLAVAVWPAGSRAAGEQATLGLAEWHIESALAPASGRALWFIDRAGSWRCDVGVGEGAAVTVSDLRDRRGRGWTLAAPWDGAMLLEAWGEPWREGGKAVTAVMAGILGRWTDTGDGPATTERRYGAWTRPRPRRHLTVVVDTDDLPDAWRPPDARDIAGKGTRRAMVSRGHGRGGQGLRIAIEARPQGGLSLTTARYPGALVLNTPALQRVTSLPPEAFLPVWSVAELGLAAGLSE